MAFSDDHYGLQIMNKDEPFEEHEGLELEGTVDYWLGKDTLVISSNARNGLHAQDTLPEKITYDKYDNIIVKHIHNHSGTGGGINKYHFDSLRVTNNKITFFGARSFGDNEEAIISYPLGALVAETLGDSISKIQFHKNYKSMKFTRIDESGKTLHNQAEIGSDIYEFTPTRYVSAKRLGQIGIFFNYQSKCK